MRGLMGLLIFLALFFSVAGGVNYYIYRRVISSLEIESQALIWALRATFFLLAMSYPSARILVGLNINALSSVWYWVASIWMGLALYLFLIGLFVQIVTGGFRIFGLYRPLENAVGGNIGLAGFTLVLVSSILLCCYGYYQAMYKVHITRLEVPIKALPRELDGFVLVHISDLHLGIVVGAGFLERAIEHANSLGPDMVAITGDLIDENPDEMKEIFTLLGRLKARYGVYATTGNHEFYNRARAIIRHSEAIGIRFLRNEKAIVASNLRIYGIDDPAIKRVGGDTVPFEQVIGPEAKSTPAILLYHRPTRFEKAADLGIDLMLTGHTHGGQLWPIGHIVRLFYPKLHGHFTHNGSHLYVSRGTGTWGPPIRLGAPPEIVGITLRSAY